MFRFGKKSRIGFDWSGRSVKVVRVLFSGGRAKLTHWASGPAKGEPRAAALLRQAGIRPASGELRASLTGGEMVLRHLELPLRNEADLRSSLSFEIRRHVPFPPGKEVALDYQVVDRDVEKGKISVLVGVTGRSEVEEQREMLRRVGLDPSRLEPSPLAALNHVIHSPHEGGRDGCRAILDVGEEGGWIVVYQEGAPIFCRSIGVGGGDFTRELLARASLDQKEAERVKRAEVALARIRPEWRENTPALMELVRDTAGRLADEVRDRIDPYRRRHGPVREIILSGGGALLHGLDLVLDRRLGIPVRVIDPFEALELPDRWPEKEEEMLIAQAPRFLIAVGLTAWWEASE